MIFKLHHAQLDVCVPALFSTEDSSGKFTFAVADHVCLKESASTVGLLFWLVVAIATESTYTDLGY